MRAACNSLAESKIRNRARDNRPNRIFLSLGNLTQIREKLSRLTTIIVAGASYVEFNLRHSIIEGVSTVCLLFFSAHLWRITSTSGDASVMLHYSVTCRDKTDSHKTTHAFSCERGGRRDTTRALLHKLCKTFYISAHILWSSYRFRCYREFYARLPRTRRIRSFNHFHPCCRMCDCAPERIPLRNNCFRFSVPLAAYRIDSVNRTQSFDTGLHRCISSRLSKYGRRKSENWNHRNGARTMFGMRSRTWFIRTMKHVSPYACMLLKHARMYNRFGCMRVNRIRLQIFTVTRPTDSVLACVVRFESIK